MYQPQQQVQHSVITPKCVLELSSCSETLTFSLALANTNRAFIAIVSNEILQCATFRILFLSLSMKHLRVIYAVVLQ